MCRSPVCRATAGAVLGAGAGMLLSSSLKPSALTSASKSCSGRSRLGQTAVGAALDGVRRAAAVDVLVLHELRPAEERDQLVELLALPRLLAGVVALGALELHAEEDPARRRGDLDLVAKVGRQVVHRRALV